MESLAILKSLLRIVGQYPIYKGDRLWYRLYGFFACSYMCVFLLPTIYLATTLHTVEEFVAVIPVGVGTWNGAFKGTFFLIFNSEVKSLLEGIEETINAQLLKKRPEKHYKDANTTSDYLVNGFRLVMGICGWAPILGPPIYALFHYFNGTLTDDKIKTPIPALMPYDITNLPAYVATWFAYTVTINFCVFSIAAIDTFYLSICVVFNGYFNDLMDMFAESDTLDDFSDQQLSFNETEQSYFAIKEKLNDCIKFHSVIDRQIAQFQDLIGPVIFTQYFFSLFQLGTLLFATIMIPGITPDVIFFNITLIVACLTELLIYCYFGSVLTSGAKKLSNAVYGCKWYTFHPNLRKYIIISMTRAQKEIKMRGFYMIIANTDTFSSLVNSIASAFTLLKSVVGK